MLTWEADVVTPPPTLRRRKGRAWRLDFERIARNDPTFRMMAGVASWLIEAPWAHPGWHSYCLSLCHLRPIPEFPDVPLVFHQEGATHEVTLAALCPTIPRQAALTHGHCVYLMPLNFAAQFIAEDEADAINRCDYAVRLVCGGRLSPDTDYRLHWAALFGDNMLPE